MNKILKVILDEMPKFIKSILIFIFLAFLLIIFWESVRFLGAFKKELLPSSFDILASLFKLLKTNEFWLDLGSSLKRVFIGLLIACVIGIPVGILISINKYVKLIVEPAIDFLRSIPITSLYPVFVLTLGINNEGKIGMIFLGCILIIMLHTIIGFDNRSKQRHLISKLYGASYIYIFYKIIIPEILPNIATGIRVSIGYSLIISTLTEMFMGATNGIGQSLMESYSIYDLSKMYGYIVILGCLGYFLNNLVSKYENKISEWKQR